MSDWCSYSYTNQTSTTVGGGAGVASVTDGSSRAGDELVAGAWPRCQRSGGAGRGVRGAGSACAAAREWRAHDNGDLPAKERREVTVIMSVPPQMAYVDDARLFGRQLGCAASEGVAVGWRAM